MHDLIRSEWRRFRWYAVVVAVAHLLGLVLMSRAMDVLQMGYEDHAAMLGAYMLLGLTLAVLQVGGYRQPSRWLWLIHRPLAPSRIFASLALAALAQLGVAVLAPLLVFLVGTDLMTTQVVDIRHYVTLVHALAFAMMAWLAGAHAATSRSKAAVFVLLAPVILALNLASVWWLLIPVAVCLAWLVFIARHSFRANRGAPIARHSVLLLTALPLQLGFFLLVFQMTKQAIALVDLLGSRPGRTVLAGDPDVDVEAMMRNIGQQFVAKGLDPSKDARVATWREQLPLVRLATVRPDIERFPVRHQFGNVSRPWWDETRSITWTFSHDRMQFHGRDLQSGASRGWWGTHGIGSAESFTEMPAIGMTRSTVFAIDEQAQKQHEIVRLPQGEWFIGRPADELDHVLLQTNRRLLAYRPANDARAPLAPLALDWEVPFGEDGIAPVQLDVVELLDGWLVSLFYSDSREFAGFESLTDPWQRVIHIDGAGRASVVGERHDIRDYHTSTVGSTAIPVASWWASPPMYALAHASDLLNTGLVQPPRFELFPGVRLFYLITLALMLGSLVAAWAWLRSTHVSATRRRLWLVTCALIGVPAFLSLICLEPRGVRA